MRKMTMGRALSVALLVIAVTAGNADASVPADRYGFANGCYSLQTWEEVPIAPEAGPFRMQATTLGEYLLYGVHGEYLADPGTGIPTPAAAPSTAAEWELTGSANTGYVLTNKATSNTIVEPIFLSETGCAVYPEGDPGAYGQPTRTRRNTSPVYGWADAHFHWTGFRLFGSEWHCGRPWHKYGIAFALPDCSQYDKGTNGEFRFFIDKRHEPTTSPYDPRGWPTFPWWPGPTRQAEEGSYYTSVERAWLGGLRLATVLFVDNEALCDAMTFRDPPPPALCNDMESVRQQNQDLEEFQDYIDAQNGGPGKGWMRIVTRPAQARRVINQGKLAVIKGVELSRILNCGETVETDPEPQCTEDYVVNGDPQTGKGGLNELWDLGIRDFFPVHKFDNAFGGTKMDAGETGYVVNAGNFYKTHHFWNVSQCTGPGSDKTQLNLADQDPSPIAALLFNLLAPGQVAPIYGPSPHCNQRGLTPIGRYLINKMIDRHFLIEIDHMDELTAYGGTDINGEHITGTMDIVESRQYPGVVNSHGSWSSDPTIARMRAVGGAVGFNKDENSGTGLGSDINGLSDQNGPGSTPIEYPFRSRDGRIKFTRETYGGGSCPPEPAHRCVFNFNDGPGGFPDDGVATYGMWVDWMEQLRREGREDRLRAMFHSAEDYLQTWEAAWKHNG
jgi:hypothetical protein